MQEVNFTGIEDKIVFNLIHLNVLVNLPFLFLCILFKHNYDSIGKLTNLKINFKIVLEFVSCLHFYSLEDWISSAISL